MMKEKFFSEIVKPLEEGLIVGNCRIKLLEIKGGRFKEEFNLDLILECESKREHFAHLKVFLGRGYYREWVEMFGINPAIFGKEAETKILDLICPFTRRIFVEYFEDKETAKELERGMPVPLSRLGFELAKRGFTWFKNWYFPEGLMEGGHKIQAEKANSEDLKGKHINNLKKELEEFLQKVSEEELKKKSVERYKILQNLWKSYSGI